MTAGSAAGTIGAIALAALASLPLRADAQAKARQIGYLSSGPPPIGGYHPLEPFTRGLADLGYVVGRNVVVIERYAVGSDAVLNASAAELARRKVDVIVAVGDQAIAAAARATRTIPIVMTISTDPIGLGVVASLARPGGNVTGITSIAPEFGRKRLEFMRQILPAATRIVVLWNPGNAGKAAELKSLEAAARTMSIAVKSVELRSVDDLDRAFAAIAKERADALFTLREPLVVGLHKPIVQAAARLRLPDFHAGSEFVDAGGLLGYGPSHAATFQRAAVFVDRVLRGAKPADLPVEQPTVFDLVVNLRTARALGVTVPQPLLVQAGRVVE
jgi:putative ABC transport system substrate-binding protein